MAAIITDTNRLPATATLWKNLIADRHPELQYHELLPAIPMSSAFKMTFDQFLLLRVIWKQAKSPADLWQECTRGVYTTPEVAQQAKDFLSRVQSWKQYLDMIGNNTPFKKTSRVPKERPPMDVAVTNFPERPQVFATALHQQRCCEKLRTPLDEDNLTSKVDVATAPPPQSVSASMAALSINPQTPTRKQVDDTDLADDFDFYVSQTPGTGYTDRLINLSPVAPISNEEAINYAAVEDEQVVNSALISFLQSITLYHPYVQGEWDYFRHPFVMKSNLNAKIYEARVDGLFRTYGSSNPRMIVEVKPFLRYLSFPVLDKIRIQEGAQMASWIAQHPPVSKDRKTVFRRLLISQDQNEIYITVASFRSSYINFVQGLGTGDTFLEMEEFGPFSLQDPGLMEALSLTMLAFPLEGGILSSDLKVW
ncbi:unnamed protein product [Clonostachys solani]|uniref:Uncharacterized protein n=1 Tax=Clonostachys solani TaxID=160281 RepID=A0A9P0EQP6_9HYPO|nr:unnamed protein product [Clonostachys solani]